MAKVTRIARAAVRPTVTLGVLCLWGLLALSPAFTPVAAAVDNVRIEALDGTLVDPLKVPSTVKASVFIFVSVDCPVSNRYAPEVKRLHDTFAAKGVAFTLVYPNPAESAGQIREHLKAYSYPIAALRDTKQALAKRADVTITPEVAVFTHDGTLAYRGRIDDRYVSLGVERPAATVHDLADALTSILAGTPVRAPRTQAVGCYVADFAR